MLVDLEDRILDGSEEKNAIFLLAFYWCANGALMARDHASAVAWLIADEYEHQQDGGIPGKILADAFRVGDRHADVAETALALISDGHFPDDLLAPDPLVVLSGTGTTAVDTS
jgi:hypothetical protein